MAHRRLTAAIIGAAALCWTTGALAQTQDAPPPETAGDAEADVNTDEMADQLNARQQIQQSFTFTRTINGEVVEVDRRALTYSRSDPLRPTETGRTPLDELQEAFRSEVLTRTRAFEEARLDFVAADTNRDGAMTEEEFVALVLGWRDDIARRAPATDEEAARQRQYQAFIAEINPEGAEAEAEANARRKFRFMSGAADTMTREAYIREYLLDFDSMDHNNDMILRGDELMTFRALNRGETLGAEAHTEEFQQ